jgi:uncharacterized protein YkwD
MNFILSQKSFLALCAVLLLMVAGGAGKAHAEDGASYRAYAAAISANPPEGVVFRADLEAYLSRLASSYRRGKQRHALIEDPALREAARAQAFDMMLAGRSSHHSRSGLDFKARFRAFLNEEGTVWAGAENAASDRRKGAVDLQKAKRLFQSWVDSTGHRHNLLNSRYVYVSTGVAQRGDEIWSVQIFWSEPIRTNFVIQ